MKLSPIYILYKYCNHNHNGINVCTHISTKAWRFIVGGVNVQYICLWPYIDSRLKAL